MLLWNILEGDQMMLMHRFQTRKNRFFYSENLLKLCKYVQNMDGWFLPTTLESIENMYEIKEGIWTEIIYKKEHIL